MQTRLIFYFFFLLSSLHFEVIYETASWQPAEQKNLLPDSGISMEELRDEILSLRLPKARPGATISSQNRPSHPNG